VGTVGAFVGTVVGTVGGTVVGTVGVCLVAFPFEGLIPLLRTIALSPFWNVLTQ
jgi:energy-converting hydrogenase Eha subunit E